MSAEQFSLFREVAPGPAGFAYQADLLDAQEERDLVRYLDGLAFAPFEFHGFVGKRRTISFGWRYIFDGSGLQRAEPIPSFLEAVRHKAAKFANRDPAAFEHILVTEYAPGAGIGWHKDRSVFDDTVGVSLLSPCRLRFRRQDAAGWDRRSVDVQPRSAYLLRGPARTVWEHSIPAVDALRYSITLRTMA